MIPESRSIQKYEHGKKVGKYTILQNSILTTVEGAQVMLAGSSECDDQSTTCDTNTIEVSDSSTVATSLGGNEEGRGQSRAELISQFDKFFSSTNPIHRGKKLDGQSVKRPNDAVGAIYPTIVPRPEAHYSHVVWLAFISGAYLNADKERRLPRMWNEPARSVTFKPISKWDLSP